MDQLKLPQCCNKHDLVQKCFKRLKKTTKIVFHVLSKKIRLLKVLSRRFSLEKSRL